MRFKLKLLVEQFGLLSLRSAPDQERVPIVSGRFLDLDSKTNLLVRGSKALNYRLLHRSIVRIPVRISLRHSRGMFSLVFTINRVTTCRSPMFIVEVFSGFTEKPSL